MTFKQAEQSMRRIAKGRYHSILFELTTDQRGNQRTECRVYLDPSLAGTGPTWAKAFEALDNEMNPKPIPVEQIPSISDEVKSC